MNRNKLEWNVYHYDCNANKVYVFNIFDFEAVYKDIDELLKSNLDDKKFEEKLKNICLYWFAHNRNWELCFGDIPWWEHIEDDDKYREQSLRWLSYAKKISVYDQIMINWNHFLNYIDNNRYIGWKEI